MADDSEPRGLSRGLTNYGDKDFSGIADPVSKLANLPPPRLT